MTTLILDQARHASACFLFAHGAGAGMDHPFMLQMRELLLARGISVARFEFDYMARRKVDGKKRPPPRLEKLVLEYQQVLAELKRRLTEQGSATLPLFIGGKSMGSRVATHVALAQAAGESSTEAELRGVICLGYPFHPAGKPENLRVEHLAELTTLLCIIQGERDSLGSQAEIGGYALPADTQLTFLADGDHSFKPRKASGHTLEAHLAQAADTLQAFIQRCTV